MNDFWLWQSKACHGGEECHVHVHPIFHLWVPILIAPHLGKNLAVANVALNIQYSEGTYGT